MPNSSVLFNDESSRENIKNPRHRVTVYSMGREIDTEVPLPWLLEN